jgi:putative flippase GtrA
VRLASALPSRVRSLAPEALAFGLIGVGNTLLYFVIFNMTMTIGAVKATVIATVITTTLAYLAHRHWTYRSRPRSAVRREYVLFFAFNLAGMLIQSGIIAAGKYVIGLNEERDRLLFNAFTMVGIGLATAFRFYVYRTLVFRPNPADHARPTNSTEAIAEVLAEEAEFHHLTGPLEAELRQPYNRALPAQAPAAQSVSPVAQSVSPAARVAEAAARRRG